MGCSSRSRRGGPNGKTFVRDLPSAVQAREPTPGMPETHGMGKVPMPNVDLEDGGDLLKPLGCRVAALGDGSRSAALDRRSDHENA
mmetsp:Transcript_71187/g.179808  ORF Transcript_71187/g.179808 Transcript_71187/m.179808 type:complete len:86 (+) Transcript_71187:82-339(+)